MTTRIFTTLRKDRRTKQQYQTLPSFNRPPSANTGILSTRIIVLCRSPYRGGRLLHGSICGERTQSGCWHCLHWAQLVETTNDKLLQVGCACDTREPPLAPQPEEMTDLRHELHVHACAARAWEVSWRLASMRTVSLTVYGSLSISFNSQWITNLITAISGICAVPLIAVSVCPLFWLQFELILMKI